MKFKIHRGAKEIGGSCVEVWTTTTRIVIDFGMPLVNPDKTQFCSKQIAELPLDELVKKSTLPDIPGLFQAGTATILIISHAHQDHYGLINYLHDTCPVYLGKATQKLIEITNIFTNRNWRIAHPNHFESGKSFCVGDIEITPYLMDHSAFDAYAFMIKSNGKSLFYSGDFRIHGRKAKTFDWFSYNVEKNVDYLLLEGTTISRSDKSFQSEAEIETEFVQAFKQSQGINLIYTSGQNIDRLVSIYRACKKAGKLLIIDFYIANILKDLATLGTKIPYPSKNYPEIKVFFPYRLSRMISRQGKTYLLYRFKRHKMTKDEIDTNFENIVMIVRPSMVIDLVRLKKLNGGTFIYSMWNGYKEEKTTKNFINFLIKKGMSEKDIHTSGHADKAGLKKMVEVLKPKKIVPIHTFENNEYAKIFPDTEIVILNDKEEREI